MFGSKKKGKEPQYINSKINNPMLNYRVYYLKASERILFSLISFITGGCIGLIFYMNLFMKNGNPTMATHISNVVFFVGVGLVATVLFIPMREEGAKKRRQDILRRQFREMLSSLNSSFSSGANVSAAFENAQKDMISQYGERAFITVEVHEIVQQMHNNISVYEALQDFADRSGIEDIHDFSTIFYICYQKGGNLKRVVRNTYDLIGQKITVNEEIETKLTSNKMQQNIMSVVPIVMIAFLRFSSSSFAESFASPTGVLSMTVAVGIFIGSYLYGRRIVDIKG